MSPRSCRDRATKAAISWRNGIRKRRKTSTVSLSGCEPAIWPYVRASASAFTRDASRPSSVAAEEAQERIGDPGGRGSFSPQRERVPIPRARGSTGTRPRLRNAVEGRADVPRRGFREPLRFGRRARCGQEAEHGRAGEPAGAPGVVNALMSPESLQRRNVADDTPSALASWIVNHSLRARRVALPARPLYPLFLGSRSDLHNSLELLASGRGPGRAGCHGMLVLPRDWPMVGTGIGWVLG